MVTSHQISENGMGDRGSKSEFQYPQSNEISVKEQRADGSYCNTKAVMQLRCALMAFERKYQVRITSNQLIIQLFNKQRPCLNRGFYTQSYNLFPIFKYETQIYSPLHSLPATISAPRALRDCGVKQKLLAP